MVEISKMRLNLLSLTYLIFIVSFSVHSAADDMQKTQLNFFNEDNATNQIPYFDNRFRIDAELDEIILIFYRKAGAAPIILVRPDGSKININNYSADKIEWFDDLTFDMIKIKKPMPGPWQAIGAILPESKIMVVSDIKLEVSPLPEVVLAGETLKIEARLFNGNRIIEQSGFREVVNLDVDFYSANNPEDENFNADSVELTTFRDDGRDLDEYAADGRFTGEFELKLAAGEWQPVYSIKMPMVERKLSQKPLILRPAPVELTADISYEKLGHHFIHLTINPTFVKPQSMVFQGKITYPNKHTEAFSIMPDEIGEDATKRVLKIGYTEPGVHIINVNAFGETIEGREFRMVLRQFDFNVEFDNELNNFASSTTSKVDEISIDDVQKQIEEQAIEAKQALAQMKAEQIAQNEQQRKLQLYIIIISNVVLITIAVIAFIFYRRKKQKDNY